MHHMHVDIEGSREEQKEATEIAQPTSKHEIYELRAMIYISY